MGPAEPEVSITSGRVRGRVELGNVVFRGIPFAKPPLFGLRFQAPVPPDPWDGFATRRSSARRAPRKCSPGRLALAGW